MSPFQYPFPQPTNNALTFDSGIANDVSVVIYTKQRWADTWAEDPKLDLLAVSWNSAPNIPTATIRYRYGRTVERGASAETTRTKKTWLGYYIKIVVTCSDGNRIWHGFVDDLADEQGGTILRTVGTYPPVFADEAHGVQTLSCVGIIAALDRAPIERTYQRVGADFAFNGETTRVAWSAPQYGVAEGKAEEKRNRFGGQQIVKSRTTTTEAVPGFGLANQQSRNVYAHSFAGLYGIPQGTALDAWKLGDVLENLVAYNAPRVGVATEFSPLADVQAGDESKTLFIPVWIFDHDTLNPPNTTTQYADWFLPRIDCDGLTLKGALDRLLAPQSGHGYWVWVDESVTPHRVMVEPFTTITTAATVVDETGANQTFPANTRVVNLTAANDTATAISIQTNGAQQYTALVVTGAPKLVVFTIDTANQIEPAWPTALEDEYNAEIAGLNAAIMRQLQRMRDIRELPKYQPIGRHWRIKHGYNWTDSSPAVDVFQVLQPNTPSNLQTLVKYYPAALRLRLLSELPFREGVDYSAADTATVKTAHESARTPWRRAEVYAKTHESDGTLTGKWNCWSTKAVRDVLYDPNDPTYGIQARELTNQMAVGLEIEITGGYQGALAAGGGRVAPHVPKIDPAELQVTVAAQSDQLAQVIRRNPATVTQPVGQTPGTVNIDADRTKTIRLGDRFQNVVVMKNTVVAVNDAGPVTVPARFTLRDDTPLANQFISFAAQYYFQPRSIVRVVSRRATAKLWPGQIVGTVNANTAHAATCNAQVSEVSLTMGVGTNGNYTAPTFTVQTSFGELDPLQFFPRLQG